MKRSAVSPLYAKHDDYLLAAGKIRLICSCMKQTAFIVPAIFLCLAFAGCIHRTNAAALLLLPAVILGCAGIGYAYQSIATALDKRRYPPPGKMVSIDGHRLHIQSDGTGGPTVILEAGLGAMSSGWGWIQPEVAKFTRVVSYDRAGLGWSEDDSSSPSALHSAWQLHRLLQEAGIDGPYVLAGHSMGGLLVRVFANQYPDETVGMVLIDASHPDQHVRSTAIRRHMNAGFQLLKRTPLLTRLGYVRLTRFFHSQAAGLPARQRAEAEAFLSSYRHFKTTLKESLAWDSICAEVRGTRNFGSKPLAVLTAGRDLLPGAHELQAELAALSSDSTRLVVPEADHVTLVTHREYALSIVAAIRHVVGKCPVQQPSAVRPKVSSRKPRA